MQAIKTIEYKKHTIKIYPDEMPENPREWCNLGTMVCFHKRYYLGDNTSLTSDMFTGWGDLRDYLVEEKGAYIIIPMQMLDHSGIRIKAGTHGFICDPMGWDSGMIGYIYVSGERIRREFGVKHISKKLKERVKKILLSEIDICDCYVSGRIFGYEIEELNESCWGFVGEGIEGAVFDAKEIIDSHVEKEKKRHQERLKAQIKQGAPLEVRRELLFEV